MCDVCSCAAAPSQHSCLTPAERLAEEMEEGGSKEGIDYETEDFLIMCLESGFTQRLGRKFIFV